MKRRFDYLRNLPDYLLERLPRIQGGSAVIGAGGIGSEVIRSSIAYGEQNIAFTYWSNKAGADELAREFGDILGVRVFYRKVNALDEPGVARFLLDAADEFGEYPAHMTNTTGSSPNTPLRLQTLAERSNVHNLNINGQFIPARAMLNGLERFGKENGSVVLITSSNGINSYAEYSSPYDESKAGLVPMIKNLAKEYAPLRVSGVAPGWIRTTDAMLPPTQKEIDIETGKIFIRQFGSPVDLGSFIAFIHTDRGVFINAENYKVDGGT